MGSDFNLVDSIQDEIAANGWTVRYEHDDPSGFPYAYTIGLSQFALPEILCFGLDGPQSADLLHRVALRALETILAPNAAYPLVHGTVMADLFGDGFPTAVVEVDDPSTHLMIAQTLYEEGTPLRAVQLCFPDAEWLWPWHEKSAVFGELPLLGQPPRHLAP
jgi:hypothetical protein